MLNVGLDKACGIDVHRDVFVATVLWDDGTKCQGSFSTGSDGLCSLKEWLSDNCCSVVAFESTGVYWRQLYRVLESSCKVWVVNPYKVKKTPGSKTDKKDSEWLAKICLKGMIDHNSRVFGGVQEQLRDLTRYRESVVKNVSQYKNRASKILEACCIKLGNVLSDKFGGNGRRILKDLIQGKSIDEIVKGIKSKRIKRKEEELRKALKFNLDPVSVFMLKNCIETIEKLEYDLELVDSWITELTESKKEELKIVMSIPGMGFISSSTILAEIGDVTDFPSADHLASWCGLVPGVYQSAGKLVTGRITKQGSKHVRRMLVQIAHVISKMDNKLSEFYHRIKEKKGSKKAAVATARKLLCIIHHLLTNKEKYQEPTTKPKIIKTPRKKPQPTMELEEMIQIIVKTGHTITKNNTRPGGT